MYLFIFGFSIRHLLSINKKKYLSFNHTLESMKNRTYIEKCPEFDTVILTFTKYSLSHITKTKTRFALKKGGGIYWTGAWQLKGWVASRIDVLCDEKFEILPFGGLFSWFSNVEYIGPPNNNSIAKRFGINRLLFDVLSFTRVWVSDRWPGEITGWRRSGIKMEKYGTVSCDYLSKLTNWINIDLKKQRENSVFLLWKYSCCIDIPQMTFRNAISLKTFEFQMGICLKYVP